MTSTAKPELQRGKSLADPFAMQDKIQTPAEREQALAIGFVLALIVFIAVL